MLRIILAGCHGRMGRQVTSHCRSRSDVCIVAGIDRTNLPSASFPVFSKVSSCTSSADVMIDFSHPGLLDELLTFCCKHQMPIVLAVTGYSPQQLDQIHLASHTIPIFQSANLSIGASILLKLTKQAAIALGPDFGASITERHHSQKIDSPSGTALMLSAVIPQTADIFSIRAGTTAGEHAVMFAGPDEVLELTHRADSREVYAAGAVRAAHFLSEVVKPGLFGMDDLLK